MAEVSRLIQCTEEHEAAAAAKAGMLHTLVPCAPHKCLVLVTPVEFSVRCEVHKCDKGQTE